MDEPKLIIQVPSGGAVDRQFSAEVPASVASGEIVLERGPTDAHGVLESPAAGEVVASLPSPEALRREAGELRRVITHAGPGVEPLVVIVEAAEELREGRARGRARCGEPLVASRDPPRHPRRVAQTSSDRVRVLRAVGIVLAAQVAVASVEELEHGGHVRGPAQVVADDV